MAAARAAAPATYSGAVARSAGRLGHKPVRGMSDADAAKHLGVRETARPRPTNDAFHNSHSIPFELARRIGPLRHRVGNGPQPSTLEAEVNDYYRQDVNDSGIRPYKDVNTEELHLIENAARYHNWELWPCSHRFEAGGELPDYRAHALIHHYDLDQDLTFDIVWTRRFSDGDLAYECVSSTDRFGRVFLTLDTRRPVQVG